MTKSCYRSCARALNAATARPCNSHRRAHTYILRIDRKVFGLRTRPPDRNGDATRRVDHGKAPHQRSRSEFCTPVFPFPVKMRAVLVMVRRRTRKAAASGAARLEQSHGRATRGGGCPPSARRHHSARDFRNEVRTAFIFRDRMAARTSVPYFASRSWIRNLGAAPNGNASRNCWMIQLLVGCFVHDAIGHLRQRRVLHVVRKNQKAA